MGTLCTAFATFLQRSRAPLEVHEEPRGADMYGSVLGKSRNLLFGLSAPNPLPSRLQHDAWGFVFVFVLQESSHARLPILVKTP